MTMASPLLETKLYAPRWRRGVVPRPRLSERLNRGAESKLTLVSAPAGFGKTTLLAEWLATVPAEERSTAWLSLDESDNRAASFWSYLIAALQKVAPGIGANASSLLQLAQPPAIESVLASVLNELNAISKDVVLVQDDYHLSAPPIWNYPIRPRTPALNSEPLREVNDSRAPSTLGWTACT